MSEFPQAPGQDKRRQGPDNSSAETALDAALLDAVSEAFSSAFIVYDRAVASEAIPMVDNSRSAKVFASFQANIDAAVPDDAPGWILSRYNTLTQACATPAAPVAAEPAPSN